MSEVEQSIQLQIQDIAAVAQAFSASLTGRDPETLWWLVDYSENIVYENRVKGSTILGVDNKIASVNIGSFFSDWFNLQNSYFAQDKPFAGSPGGQNPQTLQAAVATVYRWRVPQYFNDMATSGGGQAVSAQYVFPHQDMELGIYAVTGAEFTKGVGPVDSTVCGPGILRVAPHLAAIGAAPLPVSLTAVYPDGTVGTITGTLPPGADPTVSVPLGGTVLTAAYTAATGLGIVSVASTNGFKIGPLNLVVITEDITVAGELPLWATEVAEVVAIGSNQLTLRQPAPAGAATPFTNGLRNDYTTAAKVYPLFTDVQAVTSTGGTDGDQVLVSFHPDWAQGFVDITSIVVPQSKGGQSRGIVKAESASGTDTRQKPSTDNTQRQSALRTQPPVAPKVQPPDASKKTPA